MKNSMYRFIHLLYVPTMACNMACRYCYLEENTKDEWAKQDALETLEYAIEKMTESNVIPFNISLHGGEVTTLSKKDFEKVIAYIDSYYKKNKTLIESNGFPISPPHIKTNLFDIKKHIETIKKYNISISGSLDLPLDVHDEYRLTKGNEKTKDIILENVKLLQDLPNKKKVSATIFEEHFNLDKIVEDIKYLDQETCLDMNDFNFMIGFDYNSNGLLHPIGEDKQVELYQRMKKEFMNSSLEEGFKSAWFAEFGPEYCTNCTNCGDKFFLLEKNGDMYSCVRGQKNPDFYYGNIYQNSVEEILEKAHQKILEAHQRVGFHEDCASCKYLYLCKTGCPFVKNVYQSSKSYTCLLQKELYKDNALEPDGHNDETVYEYVCQMHPKEMEKYYPTRNNEYKDLKELIQEDSKLTYIYDANSFMIKIGEEEYHLTSQVLNRVRHMVYVDDETEMVLYVKKHILTEESPYPNNNALYIMLLSGDTIEYGDEKRTKQAHIMTHQIYKGVLDATKSDKDGFYRVDLAKVLRAYYPYLSTENPNNLFVTTTDLRDYHYQKQKNNAYYHIDTINLPFQNIEFYYIGGDKND